MLPGQRFTCRECLFVCLFESTVSQEDGSGVKALSTKSDNLSLIPRTYMIGENQLLEIVL